MRFYCHCLNVNVDTLEVNDDQETLTNLIPVDLVQFVNVAHELVVCEVPSDQSDETTVKDVYHDPNYAKIAKIVLPNTMNSINMTRSSGSQDDNSQHDCDHAQQMYRQTIEVLERETEERIRIYQREQEELLERKTESLNKELDTVLNLMRSASKHSSNIKGSPTLQTSSSYINENSTESGFGSDIFDISATDYGRNSSTIERTFSERNSNLDEETNDDPMLDNRGWFIENSNASNFATSVPKTINFRPTSAYSIPQQNTTNADDMDDLERIGKSFRDLSRSMCTDGTELFGDLPSPRLNSRRT